MMSDTTTATAIPHFKDNFWESLEANGITTLIERMRGAKQTCERYKHAYEARVLLEEEYGKTLLQIAEKQKASSVENGSSRSAMDTTQQEFMSVAESHLHLSKLLRENVATPLGALLNKQKVLRKEAQTSIQKLYNSRQIQVQLVRKAHKRHNLEIEKANLLVQQATENETHATFERAKITIDELKRVYDEALKDLEKPVDDWNIEWKKTCDSFERLEIERLVFFKSNLSNCANLMIGCLEKEMQACERVSTKSDKIDAVQDLVEFIKINKSSDRIPSPMDYIKLHAYHEANQDRGDLKHTHNILDYHNESEDRAHQQYRRRKSSVSSMASESTGSISKSSLLMRAAAATTAAADNKVANLKEVVKPSPAIEMPSTEPVLMMGVMEVYPSDEEDGEYVTETETESEEEQQEQVEVIEAIRQNAHTLPENVQQEAAHPKVTEAVQKPTKAEPTHNRNKQDDKVDRLKFAYQDIKKDRTTPPSSLIAKKPFSRPRRVSFADYTEPPIDISPANSSRIVDRKNVIPRYAQSPVIQDTQPQEDVDDGEEDYEGTSEAAALELDAMLRELDSKRIIRNGEESTRYNRQINIKPTASISSPSSTQQQLQQRKSIPSQYYQRTSHQGSRRMSSIEPSNPQYGQSGSIRSTTSSGHMSLYDPFNSLSSKQSSTISTKDGSMESNASKTIPPSVQSMHERMLKNTYHGSVSSASSSGGSVRSISQQDYSNDKFTRDYIRVGSKPYIKMDEDEPNFIDFASAQYDYTATEEEEIDFSQGDLFGIIKKNEDGDPGWWVASLITKNREIVRTGLVPSNFLELCQQTS